MASGSWPYFLLTAVVALGISVLFVTVLDVSVGAFAGVSAWTGGSEYALTGRQRLLVMWDYTLAMVVTSICMTALWASRRGQ